MIVEIFNDSGHRDCGGGGGDESARPGVTLDVSSTCDCPAGDTKKWKVTPEKEEEEGKVIRNKFENRK
ncbi:hypothetical protein E2C01_089781 [Portunus trituberculatus]|uniref:Uncharacterized protein n=1 Tax=Portunus trituberculatus TaxID=210409 RepID=A0A5B7JQJ3_PORTR|nr:hypothetical protein [Portunus trituberculatus]